MFIDVPKVSKLQWHPFTVTSSCNMETDNLSVAIKAVGSWSNKLYKELSSTALDRLNVSVEGPYGPSSSHFLRCGAHIRQMKRKWFLLIVLNYCSTIIEQCNIIET